MIFCEIDDIVLMTACYSENKLLVESGCANLMYKESLPSEEKHTFHHCVPRGI
jgi:hypothetical protein